MGLCSLARPAGNEQRVWILQKSSRVRLALGKVLSAFDPSELKKMSIKLTSELNTKCSCIRLATGPGDMLFNALGSIVDKTGLGTVGRDS